MESAGAGVDTVRKGQRVEKIFQAMRAQYERTKLSIVTINGCFDILHVGHLDLLRVAVCQAGNDYVFLALTQDDYIRKTKGANRPFNCFADRMQMLLALRYRLHVFPWDAANYLDFFSRIPCPFMLVKEAEYVAPPGMERIPHTLVGAGKRLGVCSTELGKKEYGG